MDLASPLSSLDTAQLRRVAGAMGTNPAAVFEDEHGRRFYIKTLESKAHAQSELLAAALYKLAGAPTLTYVPAVAPDQVATVLVALEKKRITSLSEDERRQAQHWFGVHAWTANWDAAGFEGDNQGVVQGVVLTLDVGGALEFRAQGYPKGKAFGTCVGELESLRTEQNNPLRRQALWGHQQTRSAAGHPGGDADSRRANPSGRAGPRRPAHPRQQAHRTQSRYAAKACRARLERRIA
jgi:hypothetical protein